MEVKNQGKSLLKSFLQVCQGHSKDESIRQSSVKHRPSKSRCCRRWWWHKLIDKLLPYGAHPFVQAARQPRSPHLPAKFRTDSAHRPPRCCATCRSPRGRGSDGQSETRTLNPLWLFLSFKTSIHPYESKLLWKYFWCKIIPEYVIFNQ